ncbi:hypothetical protein MP228_008648 [Amoeboaphelidium protococcarum]|nr:hypothetical protein MP228_008648 [Amoeboaphelidium protococcarum]
MEEHTKATKELSKTLASYNKEQLQQIAARVNLEKDHVTKSELLQLIVDTGLTVQQLQFSFCDGMTFDQTTALLLRIGRIFCQKFDLVPVNDNWISLSSLVAAIMARWHSSDWSRFQESDAIKEVAKFLSVSQDKLLQAEKKLIRLDIVSIVVAWYNGAAFTVALVHQLLSRSNAQSDTLTPPQLPLPRECHTPHDIQSPAFSESNTQQGGGPLTRLASQVNSGSTFQVAIQSISASSLVQQQVIQDFSHRLLQGQREEIQLTCVKQVMEKYLMQDNPSTNEYKLASDWINGSVDEYRVCMILKSLLNRQDRQNSSGIGELIQTLGQYMPPEQFIHLMANLLYDFGISKPIDLCCLCLRLSSHLVEVHECFERLHSKSGGFWINEVFGDELQALCFRRDIPNLLVFWMWTLNNKEIIGLIGALLSGVGSRLLSAGNLEAIKHQAQSLSMKDLTMTTKSSLCIQLLQHFQRQVKSVDEELTLAFQYLMKQDMDPIQTPKGVKNEQQNAQSNNTCYGKPRSPEV